MKQNLPSTAVNPVLPGSVRPRRKGVSSLVAVWVLYTLTFRQHLHGRRWIVMAVLFSLPAGLAVLIRATATNAPPIVVEFLLAFLLIPHALLPIVALTYAAGIIQDEQEEQTLTYLLIRPIPRWAIYAVKLLATVTTTVLLTTVFTAVTYGAIYIGGKSVVEDVPLRCLKAIAMHDLTVVVYCCLFGLISLLTKRALVVGIIYTVVFEGIIANLPFGFRLLTVIYYGRVMAYQTLPFIVKGHGHTKNLSAEAWHFDPEAASEMTTIPNCIAVLAVASVVFALMASRLCARREFHVKTPEGN